MILYRWRGTARNFGDELNGLLWPGLLPHFFDGDRRVQFLGIGSILDARHSPSHIKLVAGSGYGGYERPSRLDRSWLIHWVRGPRTAALYGLPPSLALGDPATLVPLVAPPAAAEIASIGFMPHFESAACGWWHEAAAAAGVRIIDPRGDPHAIVAEIAGCETLISEALHGIIVADALRTPWIAVRPLAPIHRAKWHDWAATLPLDIRFHALPPSSLLEQAYASPLMRCHTGRTLLTAHAGRLRRLGAGRFVAHATSALQSLKSQAPQLSSEHALDRCQARMLERVDGVRRSAVAAAFQGNPGRDGGNGIRASCLRRATDPAYHVT